MSVSDAYNKYYDIQRGWVRDCVPECEVSDLHPDAEYLIEYGRWISDACMRACVRVAHIAFERTQEGYNLAIASGAEPIVPQSEVIEPGEIVDSHAEFEIPWKLVAAVALPLLGAGAYVGYRALKACSWSQEKPHTT